MAVMAARESSARTCGHALDDQAGDMDFLTHRPWPLLQRWRRSRQRVTQAPHPVHDVVSTKGRGTRPDAIRKTMARSGQASRQLWQTTPCPVRQPSPITAIRVPRPRGPSGRRPERGKRVRNPHAEGAFAPAEIDLGKAAVAAHEDTLRACGHARPRNGCRHRSLWRWWRMEETLGGAGSARVLPSEGSGGLY